MESEPRRRGGGKVNEVSLERDLPVWAGNVVAQIAQAEKRAELYAITLRAR